MAAILRVKRRNSDEPLIALLIASKRRKTDDNSTDPKETDAESTTVLKFAGTVKNQEADVIGHLVSTLSKDELKANYKKHRVDVLAKVREKRRQATIENRYKVINCLRSLDNSNYKDFEDKVTTLIDVEDSVSCSVAKKADAEANEDYVYDVYYANTENELYIDESVTVHPFHQEFIYDTYRNGQTVSENESESENSNSESNWRNDYPDSDHSANSIDEDDMRNAVMTLKMDDDDDDDEVGLSSDDDFVYAYDERDVEQYGYKYAKYKQRIKQEDMVSTEDTDDKYDRFDYSDDSDHLGDQDDEENGMVCFSLEDVDTDGHDALHDEKKNVEGSKRKSAEHKHRIAKGELQKGDSEYSDDADDEDDDVDKEGKGDKSGAE